MFQPPSRASLVSCTDAQQACCTVHECMLCRWAACLHIDHIFSHESCSSRSVPLCCDSSTAGTSRGPALVSVRVRAYARVLPIRWATGNSTTQCQWLHPIAYSAWSHASVSHDLFLPFEQPQWVAKFFCACAPFAAGHYNTLHAEN